MNIRECNCGSGLEREEVSDARGIFVAFVCDKCRKEKLSGYRPEIFTDYQYEGEEQIEPDEPEYDPYDDHYGVAGDGDGY